MSDNVTGSGWGNHQPGAPVTDLASVQEGDLLAEHDQQFNAKNLLRVTRLDRDRGVLHGHFVDPADPNRKRMSADQDLAVWDFHLAEGNHFRVSLRAQP